MDKPTVLRTCDLQSICRRPVRMGHLMLAVVAILAFTAGFAVRGWLDRRDDHCSSEMASFLACLSKAADLGIITVDRQKLDELVCIVSEAEWEDRQAETAEGP